MIRNNSHQHNIAFKGIHVEYPCIKK